MEVSVTEEEAGRAGTVQLSRREGSGGILSMCINIGQENVKKTKTDSSQWCPLRQQRAQSGTQEMPF